MANRITIKKKRRNRRKKEKEKEKKKECQESKRHDEQGKTE